MTQDLQQDFEELFAEMDGVQAKFERAAAENREARRTAELEDGQDTEGDQPEREFEARVFLVVPHTVRDPPSATFTRTTYQTQSGDVGSFEVDLANTNTASVVVGGTDVNYAVSFEVVDANGDGAVTVTIDTGRAGQSTSPVDTVYSAGPGDALRNLTRDLVPNQGPLPLDTGSYELSVSVDGEVQDLAVFVIQARPDLADPDAASIAETIGAPGGGGTAAGVGVLGDDVWASVRPPRFDEPPVQSVVRGATAASRRRPLPRRPTAKPPLRSSGLTVTQNGSETEFIRPNETYDVECTVENGGGLGASTTNVEVFAEHLPATATVDTDDGVFTALRGVQSQLTGYTTLPPGHSYAVLGFVGSAPEPRNTLFRTVGAAPTVSSDRVFSHPGLLGLERSSITGDEFIDESALRSQTFTMRLYWTTGIDLTRDRYTLDIDQNDTDAEIDQKQQTTMTNLIDVLENTAVQLTEVPGEFRQQQTNTRQPLDLSSTIDDATLLPNGRGRIGLPPSSTGTFTFQFTAPPSRQDRVLTALYARAYSLAPEDDPANWDLLDHTQSRFMGRNELYWDGATVN